MEIGAPGCKFFSVADAVVSESALPDGELRCKAVRKAALDEAHYSFEGDSLRGKDQVNVVRHNDEGVQLVVALASVVLERFYEEFGVDGKLEEASTVVSRGSDKKCSRARCAARDCHAAIVRRVPQGLRPNGFVWLLRHG